MFDLIKKLLSLLPRKDRPKLVLLLGLMILGSLVEVLGIGMIPVFISVIATPDRILGLEWLAPVLARLPIATSGDMLVAGGILLIATFIAKNCYLMWFHFVQTKFLFKRQSRLANKLFEGYMNSPYAMVLLRNSSEVIRNVTQECGNIVGHVMAPLLKLTMNLILILFTFILLFIVSPGLSLAVLLLYGLVGALLLKVIRNKIEFYGSHSFYERQAMIQTVNEGMGGLKDIRVLQRVNWFLRRFSSSMSRFAKAQIFQALAKQATKPVIETVAVIGMCTLAIALYIQGRGVDTIVPLLALFGAATVRLLPAILEVVSTINNFRFYQISVDSMIREVENLQHVKPMFPAASRSVPQPFGFEREILFENVSYAYPGRSEPVVNDLSLRIKKGEAVGLVGPSGAGKTTLVDLLLGILEPDSGRITVDGRDIRENPAGWLARIGYVPQVIFLTDDTLRRNIALGVPDEEVDEERLNAAIKAAQLTDTIREMPAGLDSIVGERGIRLSGGQRQRIGLARALYTDPNVLVLDEATSALDLETERFVIESISRLKKGRTIVTISHRLTTVSKCDRLVAIELGRVKHSRIPGEITCRQTP